MKNKYFDYLCSIVGKEREESRLLHLLHEIEFYSLVPNDDNRGVDGMHVRDQFLDREGPQGLSLIPKVQCTVLEMLIGLSYRLVFETEQSIYEKTASEWFWVLIDNLGLSQFETLSNEHILVIVHIFLERQYDYFGSGGLFPLRNPKKDQRKVEIWYQMSAYILENYPI
jgi:hypothetical protein